MLRPTIEAIRHVLRTDPSVPLVEQREILRFLRHGASRSLTKESPPAEPRLVRRKEAATRLGISLRTLDKLCQSGILTRRVLPGRKRASGIPLGQIDALILGEDVQ